MHAITDFSGSEHRRETFGIIKAHSSTTYITEVDVFLDTLMPTVTYSKTLDAVYVLSRCDSKV